MGNLMDKIVLDLILIEHIPEEFKGYEEVGEILTKD
jgi:hypothetical protein